MFETRGAHDERAGAFARACARLGAALLLAAAACGGDGAGPAAQPDRFDEALFRDPPPALRPYARWWWPGGAVDEGRLASELRMLRAAGFGGVEIQTLGMGLTPGEIERDPRIRTTGTEPFFAAARLAMDEAERLGLAVDLTLGSGWPSGGPFVERGPEGGAERQLLMSAVEIEGPARFDGALPRPSQPGYVPLTNFIIPWTIGPFDADARLRAVVAVRVADAAAAPVELAELRDLTGRVEEGRLQWDVPAGTWRILAFHENGTQHAPAGATYPGDALDALVVDHLGPTGVEALIRDQAEPWLAALDGRRPGAFFVDSFELIGELPWSAGLADRFRAELGYDLRAHLPLVFREGGESKYTRILDPELRAVYRLGELGERVREDYESVRARAFIESFVAPLAAWSRGAGVPLRLQAHGGFGDVLDGYPLGDIPESEGLFANGSFDFLKLASSAAHVRGLRTVSSESFVAITLTQRDLSSEDLHLLATRALAAGINRIVYHGFPHAYLREDGSRYYPFPGGLGIVRAGPLPITSRFDERHPAWPELPALNLALTRTAYAMTRGEHRADVAWLLARREIEDGSFLLLDGPTPRQGESEESRSLGAAGLVYDRVSRAALAGASVEGERFRIGEATYGALVLADLPPLSPELWDAVERLLDAGIPVALVGALPDRADGYADAERRDERVRATLERIRERLRVVARRAELGDALVAAGLRPVLEAASGSLRFTLDRRRTPTEELVLVANESDETVTQRLRPAAPVARVRVLDPATGAARAIAVGDDGFELSVPARRWLLLRIDRAG